MVRPALTTSLTSRFLAVANLDFQPARGSITALVRKAKSRVIARSQVID
jgi:hypothetical protein